jgi:hypothetical protein
VSTKAIAVVSDRLNVLCGLLVPMARKIRKEADRFRSNKR